MSFTEWSSSGSAVAGNITINDGYFADGTAASPSITFTSDPNTGIYKSTSHTIGFAANGLQAATLSSTTLDASGGNITLQGALTITNRGSGQLGLNSNSLIVGNAGQVTAVGTAAGISVQPNQSITNAVDVAPSGGTTTIAYSARNNSISRFASWGTVGNEIFGFYGSANVGAAFNASISLSQPISGASQVSSAGVAVFKYDTTKRVTPQLAYDGYGFHDIDTCFVKFKNVNQVVSGSTVLVDDNDLNFGTLDAFSRYTIIGWVPIANSSTGGVKMDIAGTAGVSTLAVDFTVDDETATNLNKAFRLTSLGSGGNGVSATSGDSQSVSIVGAIQVSTAGTFKFQIAQNSAAGNTTFLAGGWVKLQKI